MESIESLLLDLRNDPGAPDRPRVTLSYAQSLDGSIAARRDRPLAISGSDSLQMTHLLRAEHQAILVGVGTVLADDPRLTVRMVDGENPRPVILDSQLRTPPTATLLGNGGPPPLVVAATEADPVREKSLTKRGAHVLRLPTESGNGISLQALLPALVDLGIRRLMVEGGARVITAFLAQRLVDWLVVTIAPVLVGGLRAVGQLLPTRADMADAEGIASTRGIAHAFPALQDLQFIRVGADLVLWGRLRRQDG